MNEDTSLRTGNDHGANEGHKLGQPLFQQLSLGDLPGLLVPTLSTEWSVERATMVIGGRERLTLLVFHKSFWGFVDVIVSRGTASGNVLFLAIGRTFMAHFAALPKGRDVS